MTLRVSARAVQELLAGVFPWKNFAIGASVRTIQCGGKSRSAEPFRRCALNRKEITKMTII